MFDETRECYICSNACGWIAGKKVRHVPYTLCMYHVRIIFCRPQWVHRLNAFRVEAAWKLGQWGDLEQYLKAVSTGIVIGT